MKGSETRLVAYMQGANNRFVIPVFGDEADYIQGSNLTANYKFFYERIRKEEISVSELYDAICRLEIISITLNQDDNPQLIFESLNSTGVALSEGDKIRNFILMGLPSKEQNDYYEKYWNKIEQCTDYDVSSFVRDWLSVKQQATPAISRIYYTFKLYVEDKKAETETLLTDLLSYAKRYEMLLHGDRSNKDLNACVFRLNRLETTVTRPFFLEVLRLYDDRKLTKDEVTTIFLTTETYLFRRSICDLPTNTLNKIFLTLHKDIIRFDGTDDNYVAKFKYVLLSKKERARFPSDNEFTEAFATRQIYQMNSKNKVYVLERLENYGTIEDKDIYRHVDDGDYSIEHIMPQHLSNAWIDMLGENYIAIHEEWLHRIANLTLTAYNSKYSNSSFSEKKTMDHGFIDSGIRMNQEIARYDKWTIDEIKDRGEKLTKRALTIWQLPTTDFVPAERPMDTYSLDDDTDLSGRVIARFTFHNAEQPVTSWIEMFESVVKSLHNYIFYETFYYALCLKAFGSAERDVFDLGMRLLPWLKSEKSQNDFLVGEWKMLNGQQSKYDLARVSVNRAINALIDTGSGEPARELYGEAVACGLSKNAYIEKRILS